MRAVKLLYGASVLMVLGFIIHVAVDYHTYCTTLNSAPFWIWIAVDALLWLIPSALSFVAGLVVSKIKRNKEKIK